MYLSTCLPLPAPRDYQRAHTRVNVSRRPDRVTDEAVKRANGQIALAAGFYVLHVYPLVSFSISSRSSRIGSAIAAQGTIRTCRLYEFRIRPTVVFSGLELTCDGVKLLRALKRTVQTSDVLEKHLLCVIIIFFLYIKNIKKKKKIEIIKDKRLISDASHAFKPINKSFKCL